jgi:hypothetical protein
MAQKPGFDMSKVSTADKILVVGGLLFFLDTLLFHWQGACADTGVFGKFCVGVSAWSGSAAFLGVLAGLCAIALAIWIVIGLLGVSLGAGIPVGQITLGLAAATVVFGLLKFLFSAFNSGQIGAWIGIVLILALAYGAYMKWQETQTTAPPPAAPGGGFTA